MDAYLFVWETSSWERKMGYCYSKEKADKIDKAFLSLLGKGKIDWHVRIRVEGYNLSFPGLTPIDVELLEKEAFG